MAPNIYCGVIWTRSWPSYPPKPLYYPLEPVFELSVLAAAHRFFDAFSLSLDRSLSSLPRSAVVAPNNGYAQDLNHFPFLRLLIPCHCILVLLESI